MSSKSHAPSHAAAPEGASPQGPSSGRARQKAVRAVVLLLARYHVRNIKRLFDEFDRDILLPILLGEIALHNIGAFENGGELRGTFNRLGEDGDEECVLKPCNAYSIAAATGLPRETVRRKVARLAELGWIRKRHNGHLYVTSRALRHFSDQLQSRDLPELLALTDRVRQLLSQ